MANFIVCQNKERFKTTKHNLRLTFTQRTTVAEISDPLFPMNIFDLRPYDQLINKVDVDETELFDLIGEIVGFSEVKTHIQAGISMKFMNIELEDDERNKLSAIFWGEFVDQIVPHLLNSNNQPIIVVMQLIKAHKFQDSYSVRNTWNTSKLWINPNFSQYDEFKIQASHMCELTEASQQPQKQPSVSCPGIADAEHGAHLRARRCDGSNRRSVQRRRSDPRVAEADPQKQASYPQMRREATWPWSQMRESSSRSGLADAMGPWSSVFRRSGKLTAEAEVLPWCGNTAGQKGSYK
nr:uncharacterized protein LOC104116422 [Nicotiana tomentosiformis]